MVCETFAEKVTKLPLPLESPFLSCHVSAVVQALYGRGEGATNYNAFDLVRHIQVCTCQDVYLSVLEGVGVFIGGIWSCWNRLATSYLMGWVATQQST